MYVLLILVILAVFSSMIAGDVFISKIAFETKPSINCIATEQDIQLLLDKAKAALVLAQADASITTTTATATATGTTTTIPTPTKATTITDLQAQIVILEQAIKDFKNKPKEEIQPIIYNIKPPILINRAINLKESDIGIARFRVVLNWIIFIILTLFSILLIAEYNKYKSSRGSYIFYTICINLLWLFLLVGGIFTSQYVFLADHVKCNNDDYYNYNLNDISLNLVKIYSILSFLITFGIIALFIYLII